MKLLLKKSRGLKLKFKKQKPKRREKEERVIYDKFGENNPIILKILLCLKSYDPIMLYNPIILKML